MVAALAWGLQAGQLDPKFNTSTPNQQQRKIRCKRVPADFSNPNQQQRKIIRLACCAVISSWCPVSYTWSTLLVSALGLRIAYKYTQMDAQAQLPTTIQLREEEKPFFISTLHQGSLSVCSAGKEIMLLLLLPSWLSYASKHGHPL